MAGYKVPEEISQTFTNVGEAMLDQFSQAFSETLKAVATPWAPTTSPVMNNLFEAQWKMLGQMTELYTSSLARQFGSQPEPVASPAKTDKRFGDKAWEEEPALDFIKQSYLIGADYLKRLVDGADVDERTREQLRFFTRQFIDATSPANLLAANPEALERAIETQGASLAAGLGNLVKDATRGKIQTTDESAFEIGRNLAVTPGVVVFENDMMQLIQYAPMTALVRSIPLLIVPPTINKFYILDLQPENSLVRYALENGNNVFLISWRNVPPALGHLTWDDYIDGAIIRATDIVLEITGARQLHGLAFCVGGTMLTCASTIQRMRGDNKIASLTLLATMVDFTDPGEIGLLVDEAAVTTREQTIGQGGILPAGDLAFVFASLRANDMIWPYVINNYLKGAQPQPFDLLFWNNDGTNLPGALYCWYIRNAYLENRIRLPGGTIQCGLPVDVSRLDCPVYVLATKEDHIVPWKTAFTTTSLVQGPVRFTLGAAGHVAGIVNPASKGKRNHWINGPLGQGPEAWLASAQSVPGSWWPDWLAWLDAQPGDFIPAPRELGTARYEPIEPAPGRYVRIAAEEAY